MTKVGIIRCRWPRLQTPCREVCIFHRWRLGFKQYGLRHITRALHGSAFDVSTTLRASPPCCGPLAVSRPGKAGGPEVTSSRTSAPCGGDPAPS
jgi:hypothetical protein